jgi:hypothetical protein
MNTETQLTAVEFYAEGLENLQYNPLEKNGYDNAKQRLLEKAIAMAEDENHKAYLKGHEVGFMKAREQINVLINEQDGLSPINF